MRRSILKGFRTYHGTEATFWEQVAGNLQIKGYQISLCFLITVAIKSKISVDGKSFQKLIHKGSPTGHAGWIALLGGFVWSSQNFKTYVWIALGKVKFSPVKSQHVLFVYFIAVKHT